MPKSDPADLAMARYARSGDPEALGQLFDVAFAPLLRVALWLCGNRADADDVVQRTFLELMRCRTRYQPGRPALPWLLGMLGNQASKLRREQRRRPEPLPRSRADVDPVAAAATAELQQAIAAVQKELGTPYAEVLHLHLTQGLSAKEIALRLLRPFGTVRTQIVRALQALRHRLPDGFATSLLPIWSASAALPDPARRAALLEAARHVRGTRSWLLPVAGLTALAAGAVVWLVRGPEPAPPYQTVAADGSLQTREATAARAELPSSAGREPPAAAANAATGDLLVEVHWTDTATPAAGRLVECSAGGHALRSWLLATDELGLARFTALPSGSYRLWASGSIHPPVACTVAPDRTASVVLPCHRGVMVRGLVQRADLQPARHADLWLATSLSSPAVVVGQTDAAGRFAVEIEPGCQIHAQAEDAAPSLSRTVAGPRGTSLEVVLQLGATPAALRGQVVDLAGQPLAFARVVVQQAKPNRHTKPSEDDFDWAPPSALLLRANAAGRFSCTGLPSGPTSCHVWALGAAPEELTLELRAGTLREERIVLRPGAVLRTVVTDAMARPIAGASVRLPALSHLHSVVGGTDTEGTCLLDSLPIGPCPVAASKGSLGRATATVTLAAGSVVEWRTQLDPGRIVQGLALDRHGRALAAAGVGWRRLDGQTAGAFEGRTSTDASGAFTLTNLPAEGIRVELLGRHFESLATVAPVFAPNHHVRLEVAAEREPTAALRARLCHRDGSPLRGWLENLGEPFWRLRAGPDGTVDSRDHVPGRLLLQVRIPGHGVRPWRAVELRPNETAELGAFVLEPAYPVPIRVWLPGARPLESGAVFAHTRDGIPAGHGNVRDGLAQLELPPGDYRIECSRPHHQEALAGETTLTVAHDPQPPTVELRLQATEPTILCVVRCTAPPGTHPATVALQARRNDGRNTTLAAPILADPYDGARVRLPLGTWEFAGTTDTLEGRTQVAIEPPRFGEPVVRITVALAPRLR